LQSPYKNMFAFLLQKVKNRLMPFLVILCLITLTTGAIRRRSSNVELIPRLNTLSAVNYDMIMGSSKLFRDADFNIEQRKFVSFEYLKPRLLLVTCSVLYGSNYAASILLQRQLAPALVTFLRFLISTILFLPHLMRFRTHSKVIFSGMRVGLWAGIGFMTQAVSLQFTSASKASFFSGLSVLFVPLIDAAAGLRFDKSQFLPAVLAFVGVAFLELGGIESPHWKDLFLVLPPLSFALSFREAAQAAIKYPHASKIVVAGSLIVMTLQTLLWAILDGSLPATYTGWTALGYTIFGNKWIVAGLLYLSMVVTSWASLAEQKAMQSVSAADTTLIYTLEPLTASAFAAVILHEKLTFSTAIGALCIISACLQNTFGFIRFKSWENIFQWSSIFGTGQNSTNN